MPRGNLMFLQQIFAREAKNVKIGVIDNVDEGFANSLNERVQQRKECQNLVELQ